MPTASESSFSGSLCICVQEHMHAHTCTSHSPAHTHACTHVHMVPTALGAMVTQAPSTDHMIWPLISCAAPSHLWSAGAPTFYLLWGLGGIGWALSPGVGRSEPPWVA